MNLWNHVILLFYFILTSFLLITIVQNIFFPHMYKLSHDTNFAVVTLDNIAYPNSPSHQRTYVRFSAHFSRIIWRVRRWFRYFRTAELHREGVNYLSKGMKDSKRMLVVLLYMPEACEHRKFIVTLYCNWPRKLFLAATDSTNDNFYWHSVPLSTDSKRDRFLLIT